MRYFWVILRYLNASRVDLDVMGVSIWKTGSGVGESLFGYVYKGRCKGKLGMGQRRWLVFYFFTC